MNNNASLTDPATAGQSTCNLSGNVPTSSPGAKLNRRQGGPTRARPAAPNNAQNRKSNNVKSLLSCTFGKVCSDIPGTCIVLQMVLVVALASVLGYLFVTQEVLG